MIEYTYMHRTRCLVELTIELQLKDIMMNASSTLRKLKDLDQLEARVKTMVNPSPKMLQQIAAERKALLEGEPTQEKLK